MALQDHKDQQDILQVAEVEVLVQVDQFLHPLVAEVEQKVALAQLIQAVAVELIVQVQEQLVVVEL